MYSIAYVWEEEEEKEETDIIQYLNLFIIQILMSSGACFSVPVNQCGCDAGSNSLQYFTFWYIFKKCFCEFQSPILSLNLNGRETKGPDSDM